MRFQTKISRAFGFLLFFIMISACAQKDDIAFEIKMDEFAKIKHPKYYKDQVNIYNLYEDYLIKKGVIQDNSNSSYFSLLKRVSNNNFMYTNDYPLDNLLEKLLNKYNPNDDNFTEEELLFIEKSDIKSSKTYKFHQKLRTVNDKSDVAMLFVKYFKESDLDCFFIKTLLLDLINSGFETEKGGVIKRNW